LDKLNAIENVAYLITVTHCNAKSVSTMSTTKMLMIQKIRQEKEGRKAERIDTGVGKLVIWITDINRISDCEPRLDSLVVAVPFGFIILSSLESYEELAKGPMKRSFHCQCGNLLCFLEI
jgi:hypothetical protein